MLDCSPCCSIMNILNKLFNKLWVQSMIHFPEIVSLRLVVMFIIMSEIVLQLRYSLNCFSIFQINFVIFLSWNIDRLQIFESNELIVIRTNLFGSCQNIFHELYRTTSRMWHIELALMLDKLTILSQNMIKITSGPYLIFKFV